MTDLRKAAEMALEFADFMYGRWPFDTAEGQMAKRMAEALRQALAMERFSEVSQEIEEALKQEPVGYIDGMYGGYMVFTPINPSAVYLNGTALYTAPPKREWVDLTQDDMPGGDNPIYDTDEFLFGIAWARAKLKEKNGG